MAFDPKKGKNVLMMSSMHTSAEVRFVREDRKPQVILDYNAGKGGVDLMDSCIEDFSCKRKTNRYPLVVFFNILDIAILNSYLIARENREIVPKKNRQMYMKSQAEELAKENMLERFGKPSVYGQVKDSFHRFGMFKAVEEPDNNVANKPGKCQMAKCRKSTRKRCSTCNKHVCKVHQKVVTCCTDCQQ